MAANRVTGLNACFPALIRRRNPQPPSERGLEMFDSVTALGLARFQFAFTIPAHIIFPAFTIGLASYLAVLEGLGLWPRDRPEEPTSDLQSLMRNSYAVFCLKKK